jgi:hypothetical protein
MFAYLSTSKFIFSRVAFLSYLRVVDQQRTKLDHIQHTQLETHGEAQVDPSIMP